MKTKFTSVLIFLLLIPTSAAFAQSTKTQDGLAITGELKKWHTVTLTFDGPRCSETDEVTTHAQQQIVNSIAVARINATLDSFVEAGAISGVSALILEKDKEVYFKAFGMADEEAGLPMARDTIVQIYSMTKPVTGVALMTLHEQGKQVGRPSRKVHPRF